MTTYHHWPNKSSHVNLLLELGSIALNVTVTDYFYGITSPATSYLLIAINVQIECRWLPCSSKGLICTYWGRTFTVAREQIWPYALPATSNDWYGYEIWNMGTSGYQPLSHGCFFSDCSNNQKYTAKLIMTLYDHVTLATIRYSKRLRTRRLQHNRLIWQMAWLVSLSLSLSHSLSLSLPIRASLHVSDWFCHITNKKLS